VVGSRIKAFPTKFRNAKWQLKTPVNPKIKKMTQRISKSKRFYMMNPIIQFFKFIWLSIKIMLIVAGGHGGTRKAQ
jgi:hypothetical protein